MHKLQQGKLVIKSLQLGLWFKNNDELLANSLQSVQMSCSFLSFNRWVSDDIFHRWQRDNVLDVVSCFWPRMTNTASQAANHVTSFNNHSINSRSGSKKAALQQSL